MKATIVSLVTLAIALNIGCSKGPEAAQSVRPSADSPTALTPSGVRANFEKHCLVCHGGSGEAAEVDIKGKTLRVPSLRKGHALGHTDEQLAQQIADGDDEMPAFKEKLTADEINELVRYIRKEFQGK